MINKTKLIAGESYIVVSEDGGEDIYRWDPEYDLFTCEPYEGMRVERAIEVYGPITKKNLPHVTTHHEVPKRST